MRSNSDTQNSRASELIEQDEAENLILINLSNTPSSLTRTAKFQLILINFEHKVGKIW